MARIVSFLFVFSLLNAEIIEINRIGDILPHIDENTWVLFDIDGTLVESALQGACPIRPYEPQIIHEIQQSAGAVLGLTATHPPISEATLKQLAYIGINFTFAAPERPKLAVQPPVPWEGGVLFLTDFNRKGEIFRRLLEYTHIHPKKIILIDNTREHLIKIEEEVAELSIPFAGFHYGMQPLD